LKEKNMREVKVVGYVGNKNRYDYDQLVAQARSRGLVAYDLMNTSDDTLAQDILRCDKLYVVGEKYEMSELAQDVIAYANLMGKPILSLNGITESEIRCFTINFCMNMAEGLMAVNEGERLADIFKDEND
jgi:hypothetical protein